MHLKFSTSRLILWILNPCVMPTALSRSARGEWVLAHCNCGPTNKRPWHGVCNKCSTELISLKQTRSAWLSHSTACCHPAPRTAELIMVRAAQSPHPFTFRASTKCSQRGITAQTSLMAFGLPAFLMQWGGSQIPLSASAGHSTSLLPVTGTGSAVNVPQSLSIHRSTAEALGTWQHLVARGIIYCGPSRALNSSWASPPRLQ